MKATKVLNILKNFIYQTLCHIKIFYGRCLFDNSNDKDNANTKSKLQKILHITNNILSIVFVSTMFIFITISCIAITKLKPHVDYFTSLIDNDFDTSEMHKEEERAITIKDRKGIPITTIYPSHGGRHKKIAYEDIPDVLIHAVISAEDKNFFKHHGIDYSSISKAAMRNYKAGRVVSGGSTITQQLIKNFYPMSRTYKNKMQEAVYAIKLEQMLSKEEILTAYLNKIFFGNNIYGIGLASEIYFNKKLSDITISEAAMLASIIKSGTMFNPYRYATNLENRRQYVLTQMHENGYISEIDYKYSIENKPEVLKETKKFLAPHFSLYVNQTIRNMNSKEISEVYTTLDLNIQSQTEAVVRNTTKWMHSFNVRNVSVVVLDAKTGEVLSMVGSLDYSDTDSAGSVNGATALRQAGSTFKPFLYAHIFDEGETASSVMADIKSFLPSRNGFYSPENYSHKYYGPVSIRKSLANSLNVSTVRWLDKYSVSNFQQVLRSVGLTSINKHYDHYGLTLALGSAEIRLLDLANAYRTFANDGIYRPHYSIRSIHKSDGSIVNTKRGGSKRVFSEEASFLITDILSDTEARLNVFPNRRGIVYPFSIAIKTGTSKDFRDAWAFGYTKDYVVGIWLGDFGGSAMQNITGGNSAVPILYDIFLMLNKSQKQTKWNKPSSIISKHVCALSGKYPTINCKAVITEYFDEKHTPQGYCDFHNLYMKQLPDGSIEKKVFVTLPAEYTEWQKSQNMEMVSGSWVLDNTSYKNIYAYSSSRIAQPDSYNSISNIEITSSVATKNIEITSDNFAENSIKNSIENLDKIIEEPKLVAQKFNEYDEDIDKLYLASLKKHNETKTAPSITSPKMDAVYHIDNNLPRQYQRISLKANVSKNATEYIWYCNGQEYDRTPNIDEPKSIRWQIEQGSHVFKVVAIFEDGSSLESDIIKINVK